MGHSTDSTDKVALGVRISGLRHGTGSARQGNIELLDGEKRKECKKA